MIRYFISIGSIIFILTGCVNQKITSVTYDEYKTNQHKIILKKQTKEVSKKDLEVLETTHLKIDDTMPTSSSDIAIVFSSQIIGKYAINATNSAMSYLIYKNKNFNLKVFDIATEDISSIQNIFEKINSTGITKVIVLFTQNGAKNLKEIKNINHFNIYLPLVHKNDLDLGIDSIIYGSIDYSKQLDEVIKYSNKKKVEFHDNSIIGTKLANIIRNKNIDLTYQKMIDDNNGDYRRFLIRKRSKLTNATLIVNMPIVKSSIVLSQINAIDINLNKILSTQLNYTPLLLSLTQVRDRKNIIVANSIGKTNKILEEYNAILGNDLVYDWVNYATTIGIEYLISKNLNSFNNVSIKNNQIQYPINLLSTTKYAFKEIRN